MQAAGWRSQRPELCRGGTQAAAPARRSAHFAEEFEDARGFGWSSSRPPFTWQTLVQNKVRGLGLEHWRVWGLGWGAPVTHQW